MWNEPSEAELRRIPALYATEETDERDKLIYEHFFIGGCDWYAAEYGPTERLFFGFAILNNDLQNAEWGYASFDELRAIRIRGFEIDRDLHWRIRKASEVDRIAKARGWDSR